MEIRVWRYIPTDDYITAEPYYTANGVIDNFVSLIWCERYQKPGEFSLVLDATPELLAYFKENKNVIFSRPDIDRAMFVESVNLKTDARNGDMLRLKGRSIESVFNRRVIDQTYTTSGNADDVIYHYIKDNASSYWYYNTESGRPMLYKMRHINMLDLDDHATLNLPETEVQPFGQNLGEFVSGLCIANGCGYKVRFYDGKMLYSLYRGVDRTANQLVNNHVIFSADFDNLGNTEFTIDSRTFYNRVILEGEATDSGKTIVTTGFSRPHGGIELKEKYVDKKGVTRKSAGATNYDRLLGKIALDEKNASKETYDFYGEALPNGNFRYRRDYNLGDTVTVQNPYGITGSAIVSEVVETFDATGYKCIPSFTEWRAE